MELEEVEDIVSYIIAYTSFFEPFANYAAAVSIHCDDTFWKCSSKTGVSTYVAAWAANPGEVLSNPKNKDEKKTVPNKDHIGVCWNVFETLPTCWDVHKEYMNPQFPNRDLRYLKCRGRNHSLQIKKLLTYNARFYYVARAATY